MAELAKRFWKKVEKRTASECWTWVGAKDREGRGMMWAFGKTMTAPRLSWLVHNGALPPEGIEVCHQCDNPNCVNPAHLWLGHHRANMLDSAAKGRMHYSGQTHCKRGHALSGDAVYINPVGARVCKICRRANHRERYRRLTA